MYATSVGLIMRGFEYLETYKADFDICTLEEFASRKKPEVAPPNGSYNDEDNSTSPAEEEEKMPLFKRIGLMFEKLLDAEDQPHNADV